MTKELSGTPRKQSESAHTFPKSARLLRTSEFRKVYEQGFRVPGPYFTAFCLKTDQAQGPKIGFTVSRVLGKSVVRNRIKRRIRESVRLQLEKLGPEWEVVFNPRRAALTATMEALEREVGRVFLRCGS